MSTLTKALIIILTAASIFLCGIVVTYVANAQDYKDMYDARRNDIQKARADVDNANAQYTKLKDDMARLKDQLNATITRLQTEVGDLETKLDLAERKNAQLLNDVDKWASAAKDFEATASKWQNSSENKQTQLLKVSAERDKLDSQNKEITDALIEKMAVIAQLEEAAKRLLDEKTQLQTRFRQFLQQFGKTVSYTVPPDVPVRKEEVQVASPPSLPVSKDIKDIGLKGSIAQVDLKNSMAEISIGAADGVTEKMKFYATRGDKFVCEILIIDVDAESAIGVLERVEIPPRVGDKISTNIGQ